MKSRKALSASTRVRGSRVIGKDTARMNRTPQEICNTPASDGGTLTRGAYVAWGVCGFGMARSWGCTTTCVPVASPLPS